VDERVEYLSHRVDEVGEAIFAMHEELRELTRLQHMQASQLVPQQASELVPQQTPGAAPGSPHSAEQQERGTQEGPTYEAVSQERPRQNEAAPRQKAQKRRQRANTGLKSPVEAPGTAAPAGAARGALEA